MPLPSWGAAAPLSGGNGDPLGPIFEPPSCDAVLREHLWFFQNSSDGTARGTKHAASFHENDHFAKTGSGQTQGILKNDCRFFPFPAGVPTSSIGMTRKYLSSVGRAANLILNIAPDGRTGAIPSQDVTRYAEMGAAVSCLFSQPIANTTTLEGGEQQPRRLVMSAANEITWNLSAPVGGSGGGNSNISIVLREDQRAGQLIGEYSLWCGASLCEMVTLGPGNVIPAYAGSAAQRTQNGIGHKRILLMAPTKAFDVITLKIKTHYAVGGQTPALRDISLYDWGGKVRSCV